MLRPLHGEICSHILCQIWRAEFDWGFRTIFMTHSFQGEIPRLLGKKCLESWGNTQQWSVTRDLCTQSCPGIFRFLANHLVQLIGNTFIRVRNSFRRKLCFSNTARTLSKNLVTWTSLKPTFLPRLYFETIILSLAKADRPIIFGILLFLVKSAINAIPLCALIPLDYRIWRLNFCNNQPIFFSSLKTQPSNDLQKSVPSLALTSFSGLIQVLRSLQRLTFCAYGVSKRRLTISVTSTVNFNDLSSSSCTCSLPLRKARRRIWKWSFKTHE